MNAPISLLSFFTMLSLFGGPWQKQPSALDSNAMYEYVHDLVRAAKSDLPISARAERELRRLLLTPRHEELGHGGFSRAIWKGHIGMALPELGQFGVDTAVECMGLRDPDVRDIGIEAAISILGSDLSRVNQRKIVRIARKLRHDPDPSVSRRAKDVLLAAYRSPLGLPPDP